MPTEPLHCSVDGPDPVTVVGVRVQVRPVGETDAVRLTMPAKPLRAPTLIVEVPGEPVGMVRLFGLEDMVKSCTVKATVAWWDKLSPDAVTVTVYVP